MIATLADLLAPLSCCEFLEVFRERKRLHIPTADSARAETLLSWRDIDNMLSAHALDKLVTIMRDGVVVPRQMYTSNEGEQLNVPALHGLLAQGISIVVNGVHHSIPQIGQLAAAIERTMRIRTQVNAYLSFSKGGAFKPHWDTHDVMVLQVHGNKQWRFWKAEVPHPIESLQHVKVDASGPPDQEVELSPGDVLFIPRGEPHSAAVSAERSVHLAIGLCSRTGIDFFDHLRQAAVKEPLLRMDLPRHSSEEQSRVHEAELKQALHRLIDAARVSDFLQDDDHSRSPAPRTAVEGTLPRMDDALRLTLRRRVSLPEVGPHGGPQLVTIGGEARRLSPAWIAVLRWLFDNDPSTLRALYTRLTPLHGQDSVDGAIHELLQLGFLSR